MKMVLTIGVMAQIKDIKISMDDVTNKNEIRSAVRLKQEAKRIGQEVQEEIKQKGIMSKPETEEM